jgi:type VI secretion system ImpA family protein
MLAPISAARPVGESLRYDGAYDRIAAARREDDATLSQGVWKSSLKRADWNEVESLCVEELKTRTKDLQIAAWLVEAWLHVNRFIGIAEGMELLQQLVERYWDNLYPQIEEGDLEYRIAPINWINEKLSIQAKLLAITRPDADDVPSYCWADWENACRTEVSDPSLRTASASGRPPKLTLAEFQKSLIFTSTAFFATLAAEIEDAMESCTRLEADLDRRCGTQAPSLRQFFGVLDSIHAFIIGTLNQRQSEEEATSVFTGGRLPQEPEMSGPVFGLGPINSRDEAYRRLAEAAEYLARVEPHSPAPYLVKRAIQWGSLSLPELLPELVRNQSELAELFRLLQLGEMKKSDK